MTQPMMKSTLPPPSPPPAPGLATTPALAHQREPGRAAVTFAPLAWLKLQFFLHAGDTEVAGFGLSAADDLLYLQDFVTLRQRTTAASVELDDEAVANHFDAMVDQGLSPQRFARCWIHTHPGASCLPSGVDERTFERVFGRCDWALMLILARSGQAYARLRFGAGPGTQVLLPVQVDWAAWPRAAVEHAEALGQGIEGWAGEYLQNVEAVHDSAAVIAALPFTGPGVADEDRKWVQTLGDPAEAGWELEDWLAMEAAQRMLEDQDEVHLQGEGR